MSDYGEIKLRNITANNLVHVDADGKLADSTIDIPALTGAGGSIPEINDVSVSNISAGDFLQYDGTNWVNGAPFPLGVAVFQQEQNSSTDGAKITPGGFRTLVVNTTEVSAPWASLSSNQITLDPGKYWWWSVGYIYASGAHMARASRVSGTGTDNLYGSTNYARSGSNRYGYNESIVDGFLDVTTSAAYELQHDVETTGTYGTNTGQKHLSSITPNVYNQIMIVRLS